MSNQRTVPRPHWWQRKEIIIALVIGTLVLIALIFAVHTYHWDLTTTTITEVTQSPQKKVTTTETGKTLWDWLQLLGVLAIPVVVGFGTAFFTRQQAKTSEANAENQQQEELLRTFFDKMSELLLDKELSTNPNIQSIVRARTLAALHILHTERKAIVLRFLSDSDLLQYVKSFLYARDLSNTDLNGINLRGANLSGANLSKSDVRRANLSKADVRRANLHEAILFGADLREADLSGAKLHGADLREADLSGAKLHGADLSGADLRGADLRGAKLSRAYLRGADLNGSDLVRAELSEADLGGAKLDRAKLYEANLHRAKLHGADLGEADLRGANLGGAKLSGAYLREGNLSVSYPFGANLREANLRGAYLRGANLDGANLSGAVATPEQLTKAKNVTPEQLAQLKPPKPTAPREAKTEQASATPVQSETKPNQKLSFFGLATSQEAEQQEHTLPKQDTDASN